jgi:4-alpha-glucanotransferase
MNIHFSLYYQVRFGQMIYICGSLPELGENDENKAVAMKNHDAGSWSLLLNTKNEESFSYYYLIRENGKTISREWGKARKIQLEECKEFYLIDFWKDNPQQKFLYTSAFSESFFAPEVNNKPLKYFKKSIVLKVRCPYVGKGQELIMLGESDLLGNWEPENALCMQQQSYSDWIVVLDAEKINHALQYKFAIYDLKTEKIIHWEEGENKILFPLSYEKQVVENVVEIVSFNYKHHSLNWKTAGVAIPVFSLRSENSFGIGEFSDLKKLVDWAKRTGMKMIQVLPVNDTTITYSWTDSYPYNAISIYALHPIYIALRELPLTNLGLYEKYRQEAEALNKLETVDYEQVLKLKLEYLQSLFAEQGEETLNSEGFNAFFDTNEEWLFPYACFCYYRDLNKTADYTEWKKFSKYKRKELEKEILKDAALREKMQFVYFTQYLLHVQLSAVKKYAHENEVVLKGDIPIGISRASVEAWVEPHLFNMDTQTGAPPDDFSVFGQNWGFPTYNWHEMSKDGYKWWIKRFRKMADYFDAYRIDHILGFFRIWEIPLHSVQGLLGYFSPALPFTVEEIEKRGIKFNLIRHTMPYIRKHFLEEIFGEYTREVIDEYLFSNGQDKYILGEYDTQVKIKERLEGKNDKKHEIIRNGLYQLCNEVLFIRDKREPGKFHPRITAQTTHSFAELTAAERVAFSDLYIDFFYHRHSQFWGDQAMQKLPTLISSTDMLVCGEDLGMIPSCVPVVMHELQILSLEIQRMPKDPHVLFENLSTIPYMSVCTTSTHDMSPIRMWWRENPEKTQLYFNDILWKQGKAPEDCTPELCWQIIMNHLNSPAMLVILPLQDWLSFSENLRRKNPDEERINVPANPKHYWRYRMHLTLEELLQADDFNAMIMQMLKKSDRD